MDGHGAYPRERYEELEPLDRRGRVALVRDRENGQLYVKKQLVTHAPEVYRQLLREPVEGTPILYGVWPEDEVGSDGFVPLIVLEEYLPGHTLAQQLREQGPLNEEDCIRVGLHLCAILQRLHSRTPAIVHRDIKPSNVMLLPDRKIRLIDFSAAKLHTPREGRDTVLIGTAGFAAPEQYGFSASTIQTDIYGLGVLLSILRTGAMPWEQRGGGRLGPVLDRCLRMDPRDRYPDVRELQLALKKAQQQRFPWLPPGFRSMCWYKAIPAFVAYCFLATFSIALFPAEQFSALSDRINYRLCGLLGWLLPLLFYSDYLGIRRFFPLMRSPRRWVRILGMLLSPIWLWFLICFAVAVVNGIFQ
jgi:hypothetical protein